MDASIILQGQQPNVLAAIAGGNMAAQQQINNRNQNALTGLYQAQGPGIAAGDPQALNALSRLDPMAAMGAQQAQLGMQATRQDMALSAEAMQMKRAEAKAQTEAALAANAAKITAEQLAANQKEISDGLSGGAYFYQKQDKAGYDAFLAQRGLDPAQYPFEQFPAIAATMSGVMDAYTTFKPANPDVNVPTGYMLADANNPGAGVKPIPGIVAEPTKPADDYQRYVQEEAAAGRPPLSRLDFAQAMKGNGVTVVTGPDGVQTLQVGGPAQAKAEVAAGNRETSTQVILDAAQKARDMIGDTTTGVIGAGLSYNPETDAAELYRQVDVMKANATVEALSAMRAASPTGGALGSVTEKEGAMLAAKAGALDPKAGKARFQSQLDDYERTLLRVIHGPAEGDKRFAESRKGVAAPQTFSDFGAMELPDLVKQDVTAMTPEQLKAFLARMDELGQ